jgi:hypothetical protein
MTFGRLWSFLAVALPTLAALVASMSTVDLAYQLRAGAQVLDGRGIPNLDTWTFTSGGASWVDQQWAAQVLLDAVYRLAGWTGLVLLRAALVGLIFGCLYSVARQRGLGQRWSAWLTLAAFVVAVPALALRPQLLGMAAFALVLVLVSDRRLHRRRLWCVPFIVLIWANIHGSFFLGPLVLGLAWLEDLHDRVPTPNFAILIGLIAAAVACVTPFGPAVWGYAFGLSTNPEVTARIVEWQPTSLRDVPGLAFFVSVFLVIVLLARRGRSTPWPTLASLAVFALIGLYAARGIAWWPLGGIVAISALLGTGTATDDQSPEPTRTFTMRLNLAVATLLVMVGAVLIPWWRPADPAIGAPRAVLADAPSGLTAELRTLARPGDRLLNSQVWGSWFEFALPGLPVAADSRIEIFPAEVWNAYDGIFAGREGWEARLTSWQPTIAVLTPNDQDLADRLVTIGWRTLYTDQDGSLSVAPGR